MTRFRSASALPLAVSLLGLPIQTAIAEEPTVERVQTYRDLPGVRPPSPLEEGDDVACEQVFIDRYGPFEPSHGQPRYETLYRCRKGDGPIFQSGRLPPSLERQKRGFNY